MRIESTAELVRTKIDNIIVKDKFLASWLL